MRVIKFIHSFLGLIPFVWLISFLIILFIGIIHFGYVPKEGNPVDPYKLGLDWLTIIMTICFVGAYIAFYLWIILSVIIFTLIKKRQVFNKVTTVMFFIGVLGFFIFRYLFPSVWGWVLD